MSLRGKIEADTEIKASAEKFHDVFGFRPHHVPNVNPLKVQGCTLHEGEWGKHGSIISWDYFHDGKARFAKQKVTVDHENNRTIFKMLEGDLMEKYKDFIITVQAFPRAEGSVVRWTLDYEKLHEGIEEPESLLKYFDELTKDIDAHLVQGP